MKDIDALRELAEKLRREVYFFSDGEDILGLSKALTDLANTNTSINVWVGKYRAEKVEKEEGLKYEREKIKSVLMAVEHMSAARAESEKIVRTKELADAYIKIYNRYSEMRDYHKDIDTVLDYGRSRLSALKSEKESLS